MLPRFALLVNHLLYFFLIIPPHSFPKPPLCLLRVSKGSALRIDDIVKHRSGISAPSLLQTTESEKRYG